MASNRGYEDILEPRRKEYSNFLYTGRAINAQIAFKQNIKPTPQSHKEDVVKSVKIQQLLTKLSQVKGIPKSDLEKQVCLVLDEIGYEKSLQLIRWLGYVLIKILDQCLNGLYINSTQLLKVKSQMGNCPIIFVPSHRSYADFILMSYVCFHYDIAIPEIAAGMDFHGMVGIGTMLRNTGAFFMRRSYNDDSLYWTTFKQYVYQLVTKGDLPIEFFIEGTRSRSNKSLTPKYGLMSMIMKALFLSQVPDIYFVPVNISYDRILEESLFAFELLGVPKPKESTAGFFKSLKILKENFGSIYFTFGEAISAKEFFGQKFFLVMNNSHLQPLHLREITDQQKALIPPLAHEIVHRQQNNCIITAINLISIILNNNLSSNISSQTPMSWTDLKDEVLWMKNIIERFGGHIHLPGGLDKSLKDAFQVHNNLLELKNDDTVNLIWHKVVLVRLNPSKFKAHPLKDTTMTETVPFVMLQLYINPILHYLINAAILVAVLKFHSMQLLSKDRLFEHYHFLRLLFAIEFVTFESREMEEFECALKAAIDFNLIHLQDNNYALGGDEKLQTLLLNSLQPFILSYFVVCNVLQRVPNVCDETTILRNAQILLENAILEKKQFVHPYSLNLDSLTNCLSTLVLNKNLTKIKRDNKTIFEIKKTSLDVLLLKLRNYLSSDYGLNFNIVNKIIMPQNNL